MAEVSPDHHSRSAQVADALRLVGHSSRTVIRHARARYATDLIKWPHRREFDAIWRTVDFLPGWFHEGSGVVLYAVMAARPPRTIVEIGSYLGRSTVFFGLALKTLGTGGRVVAIDPHTGDRQQLEALSAEQLPSFELFTEHCRAAGVADVVDARVATSLEVAEGWSEPIDLLYVDGWHSYDAVIADGEAWLHHLSPGGAVLFDDYAAYPGVRDAVHELAARGRFRLWGSIFGQAIGGGAAGPPATLRRALLSGTGRSGGHWRSR